MDRSNLIRFQTLENTFYILRTIFKTFIWSFLIWLFSLYIITGTNLERKLRILFPGSSDKHKYNNAVYIYDSLFDEILLKIE